MINDVGNNEQKVSIYQQQLRGTPAGSLLISMTTDTIVNKENLQKLPEGRGDYELWGDNYHDPIIILWLDINHACASNFYQPVFVRYLSFRSLFIRSVL